MRFLIMVHMSTEVSNPVVRDGRVGPLLQGVLESLKPEAAYFGPHEGGRTAFIICNVEDVSQIPAISEPFFQELGARVDFIPVMNAEDLARGVAALS
jgi:hypothetical protein